MPTYLYKCKKCEREFEAEQRITEDALTECTLTDENGNPCRGEVFRKISKNVGLVFNGSGFYLTDYANRHGNLPSKSKAENKPEPAECKSCADNTCSAKKEASAA